jgi:cytochrome c biogenesis protein CcmG, thiol:disulfide interchange protein DsbE
MNKKGIIIAVVLVAAALFAFLITAKEEPALKKAALGKPAPPFELTDLHGATVSLANLKGKVVLVNFWATWCDTCKEEKPLLQKLIRAEKGNDKFAVVTVLFNDSMKNAEEYMKKNGFDFPVLADDRKVSMDYGITGVPESFIISKKGILRHKLIGPVKWDDREVKEALKKLIAEES